MKRLTLALLVCAAAAATATAARADRWTVTDGSPPHLTNVWDITLGGGQISATAGLAEKERDARPGQRVGMTGVVLNGEHRLSLPASASGPGCLFVGNLDKSDEIVGVASCGGHNAIWRARRM